MSESVREKHFPALDGLRGLAALMVVAHHSALSYGLTNFFDKAYLRATSPLWIGVDLFFVLSGFLITNILLDTRTSQRYFKAFYGRRFVRIFPLYYAYLIVLFLLLPLFGVVLPPNLMRVQAWQWTYTANIYDALHNWQDVSINHFWTLAIEEQFYLVWPLIVFYLSERNLKLSVSALFLSLPFMRWEFLQAGFSVMFIYTFTLCHIDGLLIGALLSILYRSGLKEALTIPATLSKIRILDWMIGGSVIAFALVYCFILTNDQFIFAIVTWPEYGQCIGVTLVSLPLAYGVLRAVSPIPNAFQRIMSLKYLRIIGKYSYALYVLHAPICHWVGASFPVPPFLLNLPAPWSFAHSLYIIIVEFTLSIVAAVLSWNLLEKHFLKLKRYFPYSPTKVSTPMEENDAALVRATG